MSSEFNIPNIITYNKIINPSLFFYYNLFLVDTLNNDNLYPLDVKILDTIEKRKLVIMNIIIDLYASLLSMCNYSVINDKKYTIPIDILNKYNDFYILKSYTLTSVFKDNIKSHSIFIDKLKIRCKEIYNNNKFVEPDFSIPITVIKDNINMLKNLNEGSVDEKNLCNFIISIYKNIVDISYHLFIKEKDNDIICQKFLSRHNDLMIEFSTNNTFFGSSLDMIDILRKNYTKIDDLNYDELNERILVLLDDKLISLYDSLPSNYNNIEFKLDYNEKIKDLIYSIKTQLDDKKPDYFIIINLISNIFSILDSVLNLTYSNSNLNKIQLIYKSFYQYLLELNDIIILISEKSFDKKHDVKHIEGFSKNKQSCGCSLLTLLMVLLLIVVVYKKFFKNKKILE